MPDAPRRLFWLGDSRRRVSRFPEDAQDEVGHALYVAECGSKHVSAKPLAGYGGATVLEIVEDSADGNTYRLVYTVKFRRAIFVLHAFEKKSKRGIKTPKPDADLIAKRLREATDIYKEYERENPDP
jgi:phage-related protein